MRAFSCLLSVSAIVLAIVSALVITAFATPTGTPPGRAAADTVSELFWVNYAEAIKEAAGIRISDNNAFYLGSQAQKGPLAGSYIPEGSSNLPN
jgi:hypothetical protein